VYQSFQEGVCTNQSKAFFSALLEGKSDIIKQLIEKGVDVHKFVLEGENPIEFLLRRNKNIECLQVLLESKGKISDRAIVYAVASNDVLIVKLLLEHGAPMDALYQEGECYFLDESVSILRSCEHADTLLSIALQAKNSEIITLLIEKNIEITAKDIQCGVEVNKDWKIVHLLLQHYQGTSLLLSWVLIKVIQNEYKENLNRDEWCETNKMQPFALECMELALVKDADPNCTIDGAPILDFAAILPGTEVVKYLLECGAKLTDQVLVHAVIMNNVELVRYILLQGVNIEVCLTKKSPLASLRGQCGKSLLELAVMNQKIFQKTKNEFQNENNKKIIELLEDHNLFATAIKKNDIGCVQRLLEKGISPYTQQGNGKALIYYCIEQKQISLMRLLLKYANIYPMYDDLVHPLVFYIVNRDAEMVKLLLQCEAPLETEFDGKIIPVLVYAIHLKDMSLISLLLHFGADPNGKVIELNSQSITEKSETTNFLAMALKYENWEITALLLDHGAKPSEEQKQSINLLAKNKKNAVKFITSFGKDHALQRAVSTCNTQLVKYLLRRAHSHEELNRLYQQALVLYMKALQCYNGSFTNCLGYVSIATLLLDSVAQLDIISFKLLISSVFSTIMLDYKENSIERLLKVSLKKSCNVLSQHEPLLHYTLLPVCEYKEKYKLEISLCKKSGTMPSYLDQIREAGLSIAEQLLENGADPLQVVVNKKQS